MAKRKPKDDRGTTLLAAIYDQPDDDAPRSVYADFLVEQGDPRGEFIALQLQRAPSAAAKKQMKAVLRKHEREWLGPIEPVIARTGVEYARGFVAKCEAAFKTEGDAKKYGSNPAWATVEKLGHSNAHASMAQARWRCWIDPAMKGLRDVMVHSATIDLLLDAPEPWRIEHLLFFDSEGHGDLLERIGKTDKLPNLISFNADSLPSRFLTRARFAKQLRALETHIDRSEIGSFIADATAALPKLERLSLNSRPWIMLTRDDDGKLTVCSASTLYSARNGIGDLIETLEAMPVNLLTSLTVTPHSQGPWRSLVGKADHDAIVKAAKRQRRIEKIDLSALNDGPLVAVR